jgi:predicted metalloendopeptidase
MIREKVGLLSKSFRKARSDFNNNITGVKDSEHRWRTCTSITNDNMGVPIGSLYIRKYFDDSRVNTVNKGYDFFSLLLGQFSLNKC